MKKAIVEIGGKQLAVSEDEKVTVQLPKDHPKEVSITAVLAIVDGERVILGDPYISGAKVTASIANLRKGKKVNVETYKAKSHYHRRIGFRSNLTDLKIKKITLPA